jgi:hypothetical protein
VIVATWEPHQTTVLGVIREQGLEHQVIFNKGAVMVLPPGVNKATGLDSALARLWMSHHNTVGIGDADNDHAFLSRCECSVAVANALPAVKERADLVTRRERGSGVQELAKHLLDNDLADLEPPRLRHRLHMGTADGDVDVSLQPYGESVLVAGPSSSGKSTLATGLMERLADSGYQFCLIDPEGDYELFRDAVGVGDWERAPTVDEVMRVIDHPDDNVVVNLLGVSTSDRPAFLAGLWPRLQELRAKTGRPHWVIVDEAHHMLPSKPEPPSAGLLGDLGGVMLVTVHPDHLAGSALAAVDTVLAVGDGALATIATFARAAGTAPPSIGPVALRTHEALVFRPGQAPLVATITPPRTERRRHRRKYAEGELGPDRSFYFTGPGGRLNLRARNLHQFVQLSEGVDDDTWLYHLRNRDYSRWFAQSIKDEGLASDAAHVEQSPAISAAGSRQQLRRAIQERYSLPS